MSLDGEVISNLSPKLTYSYLLSLNIKPSFSSFIFPPERYRYNIFPFFIIRLLLYYSCNLLSSLTCTRGCIKLDALKRFENELALVFMF